VVSETDRQTDAHIEGRAGLSAIAEPVVEQVAHMTKNQEIYATGSPGAI